MPTKPTVRISRRAATVADRTGPDLLDQLRALAGLDTVLQRELDGVIIRAREAETSWQEIADALGLAGRQGAQRRWQGATKRRDQA